MGPLVLRMARHFCVAAEENIQLNHSKWLCMTREREKKKKKKKKKSLIYC